MSSSDKIKNSFDAAYEHAQAHLDACLESSKNTEIMKGTYGFPENPHGSGMVQDPDNGIVLFIGIMVHRLTLQDGGYILLGGDEAGPSFNRQDLVKIVERLFDHMLNRPLIELNALTPQSLCEILKITCSESNIKFCAFALLGFRQAFSQFLQRKS